MCLLLALCLFASPYAPVLAFDPFQQPQRGGLDCSAGANTASAVCVDKTNNNDLYQALVVQLLIRRKSLHTSQVSPQ